jgi:copper(I)-binding protein
MNILLISLLLAAATGESFAPDIPSSQNIAAHRGTIYQTTKSGQPTEGFMEIVNTGPADTLTAADCPLADSTSLVGANDQPITNLAIPANQNLALTPGGPHLLLQSPHFLVEFGSVVPCTVTFANAGRVSIYLFATKHP